MKFSIKDIFSKCDQIRSFLSAVFEEFFLAKQISPHIFCDILIYKKWNLSSMCNKYEMWGKWSCGQDFFKRYVDLAFFFIVLLTFFFTDGLKVFCFALLEHFYRRLVMRTKPMYKYFEKVAWNAFSWEKPCIDFISRKYFDFKILKLIKNM